ncbi:ABC transporter permease [Thermovirga sp.]|uniref:ABC transporter permease n=1 Tax=Thermovirga sp. TaxID=2699834 RepID=UPI0025D9FE49|nr:ABC transporter permease [Thermovirga sp.]MBO8153829.1 ABC transporter permease [Thermovirga sp.]
MNYIFEGVIGAFYLLLAKDPETYSAIWTTLRLSTLSITCTLIVGIPLGFLLGHYNFPGKRAVRTLVDTLLALPTVVIGLLVYAFISRRGPLGDLGLLFTIPGVAIGQFILALPIVVSLTASAIEGIDPKIYLTLRTLGASDMQAALSSMWEGRYAVTAAAVTAYSRVISEVGVSMMIGGNIKWHTRTITTAIALETGKGEFSMGIALGIVLLAFALTANTLVSSLRRRA